MSSVQAELAKIFEPTTRTSASTLIRQNAWTEKDLRKLVYTPLVRQNAWTEKDLRKLIEDK